MTSATAQAPGCTPAANDSNTTQRRPPQQIERIKTTDTAPGGRRFGELVVIASGSGRRHPWPFMSTQVLK